MTRFFARAALLGSADARKLDEHAASLGQVYGGEATLLRKGEGEAVNGPLSLLEGAMATGRKGLTMQRYKGLGEMNPEQLWETTMDPQNRVLLKVNIEDAERADAIFNKLMGEEVSLRKNFIQTHAKDVTNLDI